MEVGRRLSTFKYLQMKTWAGNVAQEVGSTNRLVDQMQLDTPMKKEVARWYWLMMDIVDGEFTLLEEIWRECLLEPQLKDLLQMDSLQTSGFSEDQFLALKGKDTNGDNRGMVIKEYDEDGFSLINLKKKMKRVEAHANFILEYLKAGVIPMGLRVRNSPGLFADIRKFLEKWSLIANRCSRDWMMLIVETAREMISSLESEITALEIKIKQKGTIEETKILLEKIEAEIDTYHEYLIKRKTDKLRKDLRLFSQERVYSYLRPHF
ncbi:hypothetical protein NDU88_002616 [Pleurodeles waltl]|uniref:Uncharacterized protein n=1 Tax=Pleurodeles waltl TaxID=8319 RepID=A0AAV7KU53_PLEWA|nr:hypothetical protein NDU88_002616 [Pleurodeles waltl]